MKYPYTVARILDHFPGLKAKDVAFRLAQSTFISLPKRYMYFEVPKAGCTQMKHLLRNLECAAPLKLFINGDWQTRRDMFVHARSNVPLPSLVDLDDATQKEVLEAPYFFRMTVVRNPYTRLLSAFRNNVLLCERTGRDVYLQMKGRLPDIFNKSLVSFNEFVEYIETKCDPRNCDRHWMRQVDYTSFPAMNFSCIVKLEELGGGLQSFAQHLRLSGPLVATAKNESLPMGSALYTENLADRVYSLYRDDFEVLQYDRKTWAASQHTAQQAADRKICISEQKLIDEIIERNLIILALYEEREHLQAQLRFVSRLGLQPVIEGLVALRSISRKGTRQIKRWIGGMLRANSGSRIRSSPRLRKLGNAKRSSS